MRVRTFLAIVALGILVSASAAAAETIDVPSKHFSIDVPSGWTDTSTGSGYDVQLTGPSGMTCFIESETSVNDTNFDDLNSLMQQVLAELEAGGYAISVSASTANITVHGVKGIDTTISMTILMMTVKERIVIFASDEWDMGWMIIFAGMDPGFSQADSSMDAIVNSFSVEDKDGGGILSGATGIILIAGIVAIVVIVVVVVLLLMRRRQVPGPPMQGPPMQPPAPPPTQ